MKRRQYWFTVLLPIRILVCFSWLWVNSIGAQTPAPDIPGGLPQPVVDLLEKADSLNRAGNRQDAIEKTEQALAQARDSLGEHHTGVADVYERLGNMYFNQRNLPKALEIFQKTLLLNTELYGTAHQKVATNYMMLAVVYNTSNQYANAILHGRQAVSVYKSIGGARSVGIATTYTGLGLAHKFLGDYDRAIEYYQMALDIRKQILPPVHRDLAFSFFNLGTTCEIIGDYARADSFNQKALEIRLALGETKDNGLIYSYSHIGNAHLTRGDPDKALEFFQKALVIQKGFFPPEHPGVAVNYTYQARAYLEKGRSDKAIVYHENALNQRLQIFGRNNIETAYSFAGLGDALLAERRYPDAVARYNDALESRTAVLGPEHPQVALALFSLGKAFRTSGDTAKAEARFREALRIQSGKFPAGHPDLAATWIELGKIASSARDWKEAETCFRNAAKALRYSGIQSLEAASDLPKLIAALHALTKLRLEQYRFAPDKQHLNAAHDYAAQAFAALRHHCRSLSTERAKTSFADELYAVYELAIHLNLLLAGPNNNDSLRRTAFDLAEQSKAAVMRAKMKENDALAFAEIPDTLLQCERDLRVGISWREKMRQDKLDAGAGDTDSAILSLSAKIFDLRQEHEALVARFDSNYPEYFHLKHDRRTATIEQVQRALAADQTLLEYVVGDSAIFVFTINRDNYAVTRLDKNFPLDSLVAALRAGITEAHTNPSDASRAQAPRIYARSAFALYERLVAPVRSRLRTRVLVAPDGVLGYVPFEALLTELPDKAYRFQSHRYLLHDYRFSYCYSATLWLEMQEKQHARIPPEGWLGMAPAFRGDTALLGNLFAHTDAVRKGLAPLPFAGEEVAAIARLTGGRALFGEAASKRTFLERCGDFRVIHLSTHGQANDRSADYSFLAFGDSTDKALLFLRDLYNLRIGADLVVLSACETGIGPLRRGEGLMSLARAFSYAGAKSIATTLWAVSDEKTARLMWNFYDCLHEGLPKDEALRQAKRDHIQQTGGDPFFWAGFIGIGDMRRVTF